MSKNGILNGIINLQVGGNTGYIGRNSTMPSFFGPFDPRKKIGVSEGPGGVETTTAKAILYKSVDKPVNNFNVATQFQNASRTQNPGSFSGQASLFTNLYIISASYGYEIQGSEAFSKFYQRYYPISSVIRKATIQGIARNEYEYEDLAYWIRTAQYELAKGSLDFMGLYIPATGINAYGFIPKFVVSLGDTEGRNPNPVPVAIPYEFDFIITEDATDPITNGKFGTTMQQSASYPVYNTLNQYWISGNTMGPATWSSIQGEYTNGLNAANSFGGITNVVNAPNPSKFTNLSG